MVKSFWALFNTVILTLVVMAAAKKGDLWLEGVYLLRYNILRELFIVKLKPEPGHCIFLCILYVIYSFVDKPQVTFLDLVGYTRRSLVWSMFVTAMQMNHLFSVEHISTARLARAGMALWSVLARCYNSRWWLLKRLKGKWRLHHTSKTLKFTPSAEWMVVSTVAWLTASVSGDIVNMNWNEYPVLTMTADFTEFEAKHYSTGELAFYKEHLVGSWDNLS